MKTTPSKAPDPTTTRHYRVGYRAFERGKIRSSGYCNPNMDARWKMGYDDAEKLANEQHAQGHLEVGLATTLPEPSARAESRITATEVSAGINAARMAHRIQSEHEATKAENARLREALTLTPKLLKSGEIIGCSMIDGLSNRAIRLHNDAIDKLVEARSALAKAQGGGK